MGAVMNSYSVGTTIALALGAIVINSPARAQDARQAASQAINARAAAAYAATVVAVRKCDYDQYIAWKTEFQQAAKDWYNLRGSINGFFKIERIPPYTFPCFPVAEAPRPPATQSYATGFNVEPYVYALGGFGSARTEFDVTPRFGVSSSGPVGEIGGGFRVDVPNSNMFLGLRGGGIFQNFSGTTFYPASAGTYTVQSHSTAIVTAEVGWHIGAAYSWGPIRFGGGYQTERFEPIRDSMRTAQRGGWMLGVDWGIAASKRRVIAEGPGFDVETSKNLFGLTTALRAEFPLFEFANGTLQVRYIHWGTESHDIPGEVRLNANEVKVTAGVTVPIYRIFDAQRNNLP
jgi:hypothetical protein